MISASANSAVTRRLRWALGILFLIALCAVIDYWAYPWGGPMPGRAGNLGDNGLWLQKNWYAGRYSSSDLDALSKRLAGNDIRYAYFHVGSVDRAGRLRYEESSSTRLTSTLHHRAPAVTLIAWIYAGNARGKGDVDLSNPAVRKAMVDGAMWLIDNCGFDGVQWDYEICPSGDPGFIDLLRETRAALPQDKLLSVCTAIWMPGGFYGWTDAYFGQVAQNCDQMTVMAYDTAA